MIYLGNAFTLSMLPKEDPYYHICFTRIEKQLVITRLTSSAEGFVSIIGHQQTADILTKELGLQVKYNRESITLKEDDVLIVAQYVGPRLIEGATELPPNSVIEYWTVEPLQCALTF